MVGRHRRAPAAPAPAPHGRLGDRGSAGLLVDPDVDAAVPAIGVPDLVARQHVPAAGGDGNAVVGPGLDRAARRPGDRAHPDGSAAPPARRRSGTGAAPGRPAPAAAPADPAVRPPAPAAGGPRSWTGPARRRADRPGGAAAPSPGGAAQTDRDPARTSSTRASAVGAVNAAQARAARAKASGEAGTRAASAAAQRLGAQVAQAAALVVGLIAGVDQRDLQAVAVRLQQHQQAHEDALAEQLRADPQHHLAARGDGGQRVRPARAGGLRRRRRPAAPGPVARYPARVRYHSSPSTGGRGSEADRIAPFQALPVDARRRQVIQQDAAPMHVKNLAHHASLEDFSTTRPRCDFASAHRPGEAHFSPSLR